MAKRLGAAKKAAKTKDQPRITNITATRKVVETAAKEVARLRAERSRVNDQIKAARSQVRAAGVPQAAFDLALKMQELDGVQREAFDEGFIVTREAIGLRIQPDLFGRVDDDDDTPSSGRPAPKFDDVDDALSPADLN
jgi:hypothetical protein